MTELRASSWGNTDRYYAASTTDSLRAVDRAGGHAGSHWANALDQVSPGIRETVERTYKQWNTILRDYLRTETRLRLAVGGDSQSVPIKVDSGMPPRFAEVMRQFEGLEGLLLNRPAPPEAAAGTRFMGSYADVARAAWGDEAGPAVTNDIRRVWETATNWLRKLDKRNAVKQIVGIEEDVLGAYFFRIPQIRLYWVVIGIAARIIGVIIEALTIVVLAHELAHAYTHLGRDIDNERWETGHFAKSDLDIVEGLAQFYPKVLCTRLQDRMPAALQAYETLLKEQSGPYKAHLNWVESDERGGKIVRVTMIECRSRGITASSNFSEAIKRYRLGVRGQNQEAKHG
jgi:hypothetical protein